MKELITKFAIPQNDIINTENGKPQEIPTKNQVGLMESITNILNVVIGVLGIVCVIVIIIGGILYMTSSGDAGKVKKAKDTILYGIIGLIVCVLAFAIVNFVIGNLK